MTGRHTIARVLALAAVFVGACGSPQPSAPLLTATGETGWRLLPESGLGARVDAAAFWTGQEIIVIGGNDGPPCPPNADCAGPAAPSFRDGAAYDPAADAWRPMTDAPVGIGRASGATVDGTLFLLVDDVVNGDRQVSFLGYDIAADRWNALPPPPGTDARALAPARGGVVAYRLSHESGPGEDVVYDPDERAWMNVPLDPLGPAYDRSLVWTGIDHVLTGIPLQPGRNPSEAPVYVAAVLDVAAGIWTQLPGPQIVGGSPTWFAAGGSVVNPALGGADGGEVNGWGREYPFGGILTPPAQWSPLPPLPADGGRFRGPTVGGGNHVVSSEGWVLHVPTSTWTPIDRIPERIDSGAAAVWAGDQLVMVGGVRWDDSEATLLDAAWAFRP